MNENITELLKEFTGPSSPNLEPVRNISPQSWQNFQETGSWKKRLSVKYVEKVKRDTLKMYTIRRLIFAEINFRME